MTVRRIPGIGRLAGITEYPEDRQLSSKASSIRLDPFLTTKQLQPNNSQNTSASPQRGIAKRLTRIPEGPEEITERHWSNIWWKRYWSLLLERDQAVEDFLPSIVTLCLMRHLYHSLIDALDEMPDCIDRSYINATKQVLQFGRTMLASEASFGLSLATHELSNYNPTPEDESTRKTVENPLARASEGIDPYEIDESDEDPLTPTP